MLLLGSPRLPLPLLGRLLLGGHRRFVGRCEEVVLEALNLLLELGADLRFEAIKEILLEVVERFDLGLAVPRVDVRQHLGQLPPLLRLREHENQRIEQFRAQRNLVLKDSLEKLLGHFESALLFLLAIELHERACDALTDLLRKLRCHTRAGRLVLLADGQKFAVEVGELIDLALGRENLEAGKLVADCLLELFALFFGIDDLTEVKGFLRDEVFQEAVVELALFGVQELCLLGRGLGCLVQTDVLADLFKELKDLVSGLEAHVPEEYGTHEIVREIESLGLGREEDESLGVLFVALAPL